MTARASSAASRATAGACTVAETTVPHRGQRTATAALCPGTPVSSVTVSSAADPGPVAGPDTGAFVLLVLSMSDDARPLHWSDGRDILAGLWEYP